MGIVQYIDNEDLCNDIANSSSSISISLSPKTIQIEALKHEKIVYENASIRQGSQIKNMETTIQELETKIQILISEKETLKQQLKIPSQGEVATFSFLEAGTSSSNNDDLSGPQGTARTTNGVEGGS
jgi:TolA-binding protein